MRIRRILAAAAATVAFFGGIAAFTGTSAAQAATPAALTNAGAITLANANCLRVSDRIDVVAAKCTAGGYTEGVWTMNANQTISFGKLGCLAAAPGSAGSIPKLTGCTSPYAKWLPLPGFRFESLTATLSPQSPRCLTIGKAKLYLMPCAEASWIAHTDTWYATTTLTGRPDSGGSGGNWALDNMARGSDVTWLGGDNYEAAVVDSGTFETIPGNDTPNQGLDPGKTIGDTLTGSIAGQWGFTFTASAGPATAPPTALQGDRDSTGTWYELFFTPGTTFGGAGGMSTGPAQWSWSYASQADNCGKVETWTDANNDDSGQAATGPFATDITAPAVGSC